jgi:5-methyltetrahydropteroyltriglutamate--homocysteine methyltransferase
MATASNLGFPRIGPARELKKALEEHWSGNRSEADLLETGRALRTANRQFQKEAGLRQIPSNEFSFYDHVLDTVAMVGAVPPRYGWTGDSVDMRTYFAMARGIQDKAAGLDVPAMEMTKWFDTNYHYIVPEFEPGQSFRLASTKPVDEYTEAKAEGLDTRPVLLGPVSFLLLGKASDRSFDPISLLDALLPVYEETLKKLAEAGAGWVQIDEPFLAMDMAPEARTAFETAYARLSGAAPSLRILIAAYFEGLRENLGTALRLPVAAVHLDLVRAPDQLEPALAEAPSSLALSLGVVDGRNIWKTDLDRALGMVEKAVAAIGPDRVFVAPSCSLIHVPIDLDMETELDRELRTWLAFAKQKVGEVVLLARAAREGREAVREDLDANRVEMERRRTSKRIHDDEVKKRVAAVTSTMLRRNKPYAERRPLQQSQLNLPLFPTTTIGSFPQTPEVRAARAEFRAGKRTLGNYERFLRGETESAIRFQEEIGLDLLVHGEFERNDMVEYFGEQLSGFAFTKFAWVQSYGSRYVKPPIIYGDVERPETMTVEWSRFAQSITEKPVKGMITGPVTIMQWSFVRDDQPRPETCRQLALVIRDEAIDLEEAGIKVIQIDEPAIKEGMPLRKADSGAYLTWAVECFRIASTGVRDETQIQTHMCYSEFNDIMDSVAAMDADVILIETTRSRMELLDAFKKYKYPNEIGPGIYDIHSPRVPGREEMEVLLRKALEVLSPTQIWVTPDCGLKTRKWEEVQPSLTRMVEAARSIRESVAATA